MDTLITYSQHALSINIPNSISIIIYTNTATPELHINLVNRCSIFINEYAFHYHGIDFVLSFDIRENVITKVYLKSHTIDNISDVLASINSKYDTSFTHSDISKVYDYGVCAIIEPDTVQLLYTRLIANLIEETPPYIDLSYETLKKYINKIITDRATENNTSPDILDFAYLFESIPLMDIYTRHIFGGSSSRKYYFCDIPLEII